MQVKYAHEATRFDLSDDQQAMLNHLSEFGYAVVANVADEAQIRRAKDSFWEFWENDTRRVGLNRYNPSTWKNWVANGATGIMVSSGGTNHSDFHWNTRTLPKVKEAFAKIWKTHELVVSFDAGGVFRDWRYDLRWLTNGGWWHVDQNARRGKHRQGLQAVQGLVTYYDSTAETGGLCVIPGSHKEHHSLCERAPGASMNMDFVPVPKNDPIFQMRENASISTSTGEASDGVGILICAKAGDLILWDSRLVHCNTPALSQVNHHQEVLDKKAGSDYLDRLAPLPSETCTAAPQPQPQPQP
eukprot:CAMPEP_0174980186 /NCGR_PEP_ID=MMETSP0004_2-20121128/15216_1 /TAXON_ID=420556 /ORGANISM="Ochromonas sp., Strain CCMP1393" /LENGTH=299 /DNA_ID=CAMNT_0016231835 /DNA_START=70 /DNA_END=969 /DNA_ORIENTATION=+